VGINAAVGCGYSTAAVRSAVGICEGRMLLLDSLGCVRVYRWKGTLQRE
jgi:hypothetical protein